MTGSSCRFIRSHQGLVALLLWLLGDHLLGLWVQRAKSMATTALVASLAGYQKESKRIQTFSPLRYFQYTLTEEPLKWILQQTAIDFMLLKLHLLLRKDGHQLTSGKIERFLKLKPRSEALPSDLCPVCPLDHPEGPQPPWPLQAPSLPLSAHWPQVR